MKKDKSTYIILTIIVIVLLVFFIRIFIDDDKEEKNIKVINEQITLNDKKVDVAYQIQKELDITLTYGNIDTKIIKLTNNNDEDIVYALKYSNSYMSNEDIVYDVYVSTNGKDYKELLKEKRLIANTTLIYNIVLGKNSSNYIKIVFKSLHENEETIIKGNIEISDNLSSLELFNISVNNLKDALEDKVVKLNGISTKGYYYLDINNLSFTNDAAIKGYIIIDSEDISNIKYVYTVYNEKYMIKNLEYKNINVMNVDTEYVNSLDETKACSLYDTRIKCSDFMSVPKSARDEKKEFYNNSKKIINQFINEYNKDDDKTYIYDISKDISNDTDIVGYILKNKDDMFIYLRNELYMISGYNYTKLGEYDIKSTTIRSYNTTAFDLAAKDMNTVCIFSGYQECYDKDNNRVGGN